MKTVSLWQPWASLIAAGFKRVETRSWRPIGNELRPGERLAIHAAKHWTGDEVAFCFRPAIFPLLRDAERAGLWSFTAPARGVVVALATYDGDVDVAGNYLKLSQMERLLGNYSAGRYLWRLRDVTPITPIPLHGYQRLFEWDTADAFIQPLDPVADAVIAAAAATIERNAPRLVARIAQAHPCEPTVTHVRDGYDLYIGRSMPRQGLVNAGWGNPYRRDEEDATNPANPEGLSAIERYARHVEASPALMARIRSGELDGKRLGCWCKPHYRCHGDALVTLWRLHRLPLLTGDPEALR